MPRPLRGVFPLLLLEEEFRFTDERVDLVFEFRFTEERFCGL